MTHSDVHGVIVVDKPPGVTSRRVVDAVSRTLSTKTVGHAGTLDPLAAGVVVVCVGHATKLVDFIHQQEKAYTVSFLFGRSSPSDDLETELTIESDPKRPHSIRWSHRSAINVVLFSNFRVSIQRKKLVEREPIS